MRDASGEKSIEAEVGRRIREARLAAGLTQEEAAHSAGIDYKRWQRLENGAANPTLRTLERVAAAIQVPFWALFTPPRPAGRRRPVRGKAEASADAKQRR